MLYILLLYSDESGTFQVTLISKVSAQESAVSKGYLFAQVKVTDQIAGHTYKSTENKMNSPPKIIH